MRKNALKKMAVVAALAGLTGVTVYQREELNAVKHEQTVQADKNRVHKIVPGDVYKLHGLKIRVSEYKYNSKRNYVVNTTVNKAMKFDIGANTRQGMTKGITIAYGNDQ